jgi:NAD-dependent SIR2 family protein deacetylase
MDNTDITTKRNLLLEKINDADMVLVGVGEEFNENFMDIGKFPLLMSALEEVDVNPTLEWTIPYLEQRFLMEHSDSPTINAYRNLQKLIKDKNYYIMTTCIDENIKKADFKSDRIVEPCGNYEWFQCSKKCNTELYPTAEFSNLVNQALLDGVGLDSLEAPKCPCCGEPLAFNNILCESNYVEEGYKPQWERYTKWLQGTLNRKICIIELGVGMNLPNIIRWPFEKIAFYNNKASFFRINGGIYQMTEEIADKGVSIEMNAVEFLNNF